MVNPQLAQKVKGLRKQNGYSQEALAQIAGLSLRTIQRIEKENKNPSADTLRRLSIALEVSPDYFIEWEPNENSNFLLILAFSPILFVFNSFLAVLVPLILWITKKNSIRGVKTLGLKILKIQTIWLIVFFVFRTINFYRLTHIENTTRSFNEEEWETFLFNVSTQGYLKTGFLMLNIVIILSFTYKTYKLNQLKNHNRTY